MPPNGTARSRVQATSYRIAVKPESANAGKMSRAKTLRAAPEDDEAARSAASRPDTVSTGAGGAAGRQRSIATTTARSIEAAAAADLQRPHAGIARNPAAATPRTAPAVLTA